MKKWILLFAIINFSLISSSQAQNEQIKPLTKGIYLVVGSFQNKANALKFEKKNNSQR